MASRSVFIADWFLILSNPSSPRHRRCPMRLRPHARAKSLCHNEAKLGGRSLPMRCNHILRNLFLLVIGTTIVSRSGPSQHAPGGGAGGAGGGIARPTSPTPRTNNTNTDALNRSVYLSGKVLMDDGSAAPEPVVIERVCNGAPRAEGYTDSKGRFSFQLGQSQAMTQDASYDDTGTSGPQTNAPGRRNSTAMGNGPVGGAPRGNVGQALAGCELRGSLAGFKSDVVNLGNRRVFDNPYVGTLVR